jgi:hypothetical protein
LALFLSSLFLIYSLGTFIGRDIDPGGSLGMTPDNSTKELDLAESERWQLAGISANPLAYC